MANLVIGGVSGVGKSFLENLLQQEYGYTVNTKYTNRPYRPGEENSTLIISVTDQKFDSMLFEFFPVIYQTGFRYGYKKSDMEGRGKRTIAVPVKDVIAHLGTLSNLVPIILIVKPENLELLENRMKQRESYSSLNPQDQQRVQKNIQERLELALEHIKLAQELVPQIEAYGGRIFYIKDDKTLYEEVIPFITSLP